MKDFKKGDLVYVFYDDPGTIDLGIVVDHAPKMLHSWGVYIPKFKLKVFFCPDELEKANK